MGFVQVALCGLQALFACTPKGRDAPFILLIAQNAMHTEILTKRLRLAPVQLEDIPALVRLWTSEQVRKHLGGALSSQQAQEKAQGYIGKENYFAVSERTSNAVLGMCCLDTYHTGEIEVSYALLPEAWGKGFGQEAVSALVEWGFSHLGVERIIAVTQSANTNSRRLLEAIGMTAREEFEEHGEWQTLYEIRKLSD
jgi:RimJ/RimL family protein N-acetyltransferase